MNRILTNPPEDKRNRELWLQHAAGLIIFEDIRKYAFNRIPPETDEGTKSRIIKGIDDAIYGLMMMMDGVTGILENEEYSLRMETKILLQKNGEIIEELNTQNGDGMCMGFHEWKDGDFGDQKIVKFSDDYE